MTKQRTMSPAAVWLGIALCVALVATAMLIPALLDWDVEARDFPPLHALWVPRLGPGTAPSLALAVLAAIYAFRVTRTLPWRRLLLTSYVGAYAWLVALATVDGKEGIAGLLNKESEYLDTARAIDNMGAFLREFDSRVPKDAPDNWAIHVSGHPPGATLFFTVLDRIGLGGDLAAGLVVVTLAASIPAGIAILLRNLGDPDAARVVLPFLVFGPAAMYQAVSADAMFATVAVWGMVALSCACLARGAPLTIAYGLLAGLLLGACVMFSFGLPILGLLAVIVLWLHRTWRPLPWAVIAALAVVGFFWAAGWFWWDGFETLRERYWDGVASDRPASYWMWGNLAALSISAGPVIGVVLVGLVQRWRELAPQAKSVLWLAVAGWAMVAAADASQMSKAEVERIWLPFIPWIMIGTVLIPQRWRRPVLLVQLIVALGFQHLFDLRW